MKLVITHATFIQGRPVAVGDVVNVDKADYDTLKLYKRAVDPDSDEARAILGGKEPEEKPAKAASKKKE